ncbi:phosphopentomutase [Babesia ovis]|uniref:Phosphopentomutase n=1 Tax=Babesia ovis TaxID=5869 RepID=A0A9W5WVU8_BABOV|nr:phosphopentomutase [Babesia ovis]
MRNVINTRVSTVVTTLCAFWALVPDAALTLVAYRFGHPNSVRRAPYTLAFNSFELAKIFGRLADQSPIGSVLATPSCSNLSPEIQGRRKWHGIFEHDGEEIDRLQFLKRLSAIQLTWPRYYVANRQPPFLVPDKQRHKFRLKGYLGNVATDMQKPDDSTDRDSSAVKCIRKIVKQPIDKEAADTVFVTLSHEEDKLTVNHIVAFIKYRSPLLQMVNWEAFIASLPVGPEDIPI